MNARPARAAGPPGLGLPPAVARRDAAATARVRKGFGWVAAAALVLFAGSSDVLACPMCFGAEESSLIDGAKLGILVMMGFTFAVQGAFVAFFLYLRKRAKLMADADLDTEWSELQRATRSS
ncbi:MAG TPA: hypothetical protein VD833_20810 [Vicinamibacterales bacterium]|nr:hypothetical protein [Vicinamibacterales bacterium]